MWAVTAGGDEYRMSVQEAVQMPDLIRLDFSGPRCSLSFPAHCGSVVQRRRIAFRPPAFSDYPWRVDETGWVRYVSIAVDTLEAHIYADGNIHLGAV
jgi:hypothetical protein